jgi:hypothetical protein
MRDMTRTTGDTGHDQSKKGYFNLSRESYQVG